METGQYVTGQPYGLDADHSVHVGSAVLQVLEAESRKLGVLVVEAAHTVAQQYGWAALPEKLVEAKSKKR